MPDINFKRGATFSYAFEIPSDIPDGYFDEWEVHAQIRKAGSDSPKSLIAQLQPLWQDKVTTRELVLMHVDTNAWPVGPAEMDIVFVSPSGFKAASKTVTVSIEKGITQ
jgi:hypothetical protein